VLERTTELEETVQELDAENAVRIRTEEELRESERTIRTVLEAAPDAIVIINEDRMISLVNTQAEKVFKYARDELIGQPIEILIPDDRKKYTGNTLIGIILILRCGQWAQVWISKAYAKMVAYSLVRSV